MNDTGEGACYMYGERHALIFQTEYHNLMTEKKIAWPKFEHLFNNRYLSKNIWL